MGSINVTARPVVFLSTQSGDSYMRQVQATLVGMVFAMAAASPAVVRAQATLNTGASHATGQGRKGEARLTADGRGRDTKTPATTLISEALKTAKATKKAVFVYTTSSGCGWCIKFDADLHSAEIGKLIDDNYVLVLLTVVDKHANPGADSVVKAWGGDRTTPTFYVLDETGKLLASSMVGPEGRNLGRPATPEEIKLFDGILEKTAPRMTAADRKQILEYLALPQGR